MTSLKLTKWTIYLDNMSALHFSRNNTEIVLQHPDAPLLVQILETIVENRKLILSAHKSDQERLAIYRNVVAAFNNFCQVLYKQTLKTMFKANKEPNPNLLLFTLMEELDFPRTFFFKMGLNQINQQNVFQLLHEMMGKPMLNDFV